MGTHQSKRSLVTGGGQGLGRAIAEQLLRQGCDFAIHYHTSVKGAETLKQSALAGERAECFSADLTKDTKTRTLVDHSIRVLGGLEILINNTGDLLGWRKFEELD